MRGRLWFALSVLALSACSLLTSTDELARGAAETTPDASPFDGSIDGDVDGSLDANADVGATADATAEASTEGGVLACPDVGDPTTLIVDANKGDDLKGNGQAIPYRSITKALANANATPTKAMTICVRGGTYSDVATGESFPLRLQAPNLTLRGEGQGVVRLEFVGAPDAGAGSKMIWIDATAHDATLRDFTARDNAGGILQNDGANLQIFDATFEAAPTTTSSDFMMTIEALTSLNRVRFAGESADPPTCIVSLFASISVTDSSFEGCRYGVYSRAQSHATVTRSTFKKSLLGIHSNGGQSLHTTDNTFDNCSNFALLVDALDQISLPFSWVSNGDTFVSNTDAVAVAGASTVAASSVTITNAHFRLQKGIALDLSAPIKFVLRGTTFEDGQGAATVVRATAAGAPIDLGDVDAGNVFQPASHRNGSGICLLAASAIPARGSGFSQCPPLKDPICGSGGDITVVDGGTLDVAGCFVAP